MNKIQLFLLVGLTTNISLLHAQPTFTKIAGTGAEISGAKEGGAVWADFNQDGTLDILVNTDDVNLDSRLLQGDGDGTFTDVTSTLAKGLTNETLPRSAIWGDLNNDGLPDMIRNHYDIIEIYINRGTSSTPNYRFGVGGNMEPNMTIKRFVLDGCIRTGGINSEGVGLIDYNNDGWLDIVIQNGECGIEVLENQKLDFDATENISFGGGDAIVTTDVEATSNGFFNQVTTTGNTLGLPLTSTNGNYLAVADYNLDGYLDLLVRMPTGTNSGNDLHWDLWENNGDGTFSPNTTFPNNGSTDAAGSKGGAMFCDFDGDGDFDIFWAGVTNRSQIWMQDPIGTFSPTDEPTLPAGSDIDGCACTDIDLDGDIDFVLGNSSGNSYIYYNETSAQNSIADLSFTREDISVNGDVEGLNLVDYDHDGDYDLYLNIHNGDNQIWENDLCNGGCEFIRVETEDCIDGTTVTRPVVGATMVLKDKDGVPINAAQSGSVASGHGAQNPEMITLSIPDDTETYILDITFPEKNGIIETYSHRFNPSDLTDNTLTLTALNGTDGNPCDFTVLPVSLTSFTTQLESNSVEILWTTASEFENDRFELEHSTDGKHWGLIGTVKGAGTTSNESNYSYAHNFPDQGANYYRLKQIDFDGTVTIYPMELLVYDPLAVEFEVVPNPSYGSISLILGEQFQDKELQVYLLNAQGKSVWSHKYQTATNRLKISFNSLEPGVYLVQVSNRQELAVKRIVVQ